MTVKSKIIEFQNALDIKKADGYFGGVSYETLLESKKVFKINSNFINKLPIDKSKYKFEYVENILKELNAVDEFKNPLYIAYALATIYHETAHTFLPLEEYGFGKSKVYGKSFKNNNDNVCYTNGKKNKTYSLATYPQYYYGRGFVQLTWFDNYKTFTDLLNVDLLKNPQLACDVDIATKILIYGMLNGTFTGKKLSSYIKYGIDDFEWINARRIINGTDKAELIASYAKTFLEYMYLDSNCVVN